MLRNILFYKRNNLIIYPKIFSGNKILEDSKSFKDTSNSFYLETGNNSPLKIDLNGVIYLEEIEKYNIECKNGTFQKYDFKNIGEYHSPTLCTIQYINYVGVTELFGIKLNILNKKISEKEYQGMIKAIEEKVVDLIFDFNKPTFLTTETNTSADTSITYHSFRLLMYLLETSIPEQNIYQNIEIIKKNFHNKIERNTTLASFYEAHDLDEDSISSLVSEPSDYVEFNRSSLNTNSLSQYIKRKSGKDLMPVNFKRQDIVFNYNNHENRFIKFFLKESVILLEYYLKIYEDISKKQTIDFQLVNKIKLHIQKLNQILSSSPFKELTSLNYIPFESQILTKQNGYRQLFMNFLLLKSQHNSIFDSETTQSIDAKSIDKIYEIWCFFSLTYQLEIIYSDSAVNYVTYKENKQSKNIFSNDGNTYFFFKESSVFPPIKLYFKKIFSPPESYSQTYDPDITLEVLDSQLQVKSRIFFDSKFKLDSKTGTFKNEDINKMHTYLDAISNSHGSFILYPGLKSKTYFKEDSSIGVGAFGFKPGINENSSLKGYLINILKSFR